MCTNSLHGRIWVAGRITDLTELCLNCSSTCDSRLTGLTSVKPVSVQSACSDVSEPMHHLEYKTCPLKRGVPLWGLKCSPKNVLGPCRDDASLFQSNQFVSNVPRDWFEPNPQYQNITLRAAKKIVSAGVYWKE